MSIQKSFFVITNSRPSFLDREEDIIWEVCPKGEVLEGHCHIIGMLKNIAHQRKGRIKWSFSTIGQF